MDPMYNRRMTAELLPFYVNGTLPAEERAEVEAHLAEDDDLRQQCDLLIHIRKAVKSDQPTYSPGELGLERLRAAMEPQRNYGLLAASVAAATVAVGAVLYVAVSDRETIYEPAGAGEQGMLLVAFQPDALQGQVSDFLSANDLVIVEGPSAIGLYRLRIPEGRSEKDVIVALRAASGLVESAGVAE